MGGPTYQAGRGDKGRSSVSGGGRGRRVGRCACGHPLWLDLCLSCCKRLAVDTSSAGLISASHVRLIIRDGSSH